MSGGVIDKDLGWSAMLRRLQEFDDLVLTVGIHESEGGAKSEDGATTIAEYAAYNEFGTETIPERPWMRSNLDDNAGKYSRLIQEAGLKVIAGQAPKAALAAVGIEVRNDLIDSIRDEGKYAPNADATKKAKKSTKPLRDTGAMQRAITVKVGRGWL